MGLPFRIDALCGRCPARYDHREGNDDYTQVGNLFRLLAPDHRWRLIGNIVDSMQTVPHDIQVRQVRHFHKADPAYGEGVARGLGLDLTEIAETENTGLGTIEVASERC